MSGTVASARSLGPGPHPAGEGWTILGQDGGQSIVVGDEVLFVFSDTLIASHQPGGGESTHVLANSAAFAGAGGSLAEAVAGMRFLTDATGFPRPVLASTPAEHAAGLRFWPEHGCTVEDEVYLFYLGIETVDPGDAWGFRNRGVGLAVLDREAATARRVGGDGGWLLWSADADDFHLGVQVLRHGDDVHVFGSRRHGLDVEAIVARVDAGHIADPSAYRFLGDGGSWVADVAAARSLGPAGGDYSVSRNHHLGCYLMVYVDSHSKDLLVRRADAVTGPYSPPERVGRVPHDPGSELVYLAFEHPAFAGDGGSRIVVTYSQPYFTMNSAVELRLR